MTTTTIRLPEDLRSRVALAAKRNGTTAHGFIIDAITEKTELAEQRAAFDDEAEARYARMIDSGKTIPWKEMRAYLADRIAGEKVSMPRARKLAR